MELICACECVFMRERETTNNTMLYKIQHCAFVKVTPIHLAWQWSIYLFSYRHVFSFVLVCTLVQVCVCLFVCVCVKHHLG